MTYTEKRGRTLFVGDEVKTYDNGKDGYPAKWVNGVVTEVGDETFVVQWEDLKEPTEYNFEYTRMINNQIL